MKFQNYFLLVLLLISTRLFATEFQVDKSKENHVKFISDAPIENFEGNTDIIDGYMYWDGNVMMKDSKLYFEVDLNTLDTGIGLRNRHMRENYLETDKYQFAFFEGHFTSVKQISDGEYDVETEGTMNIHGVTDTVKIMGKLLKTDNGFNITSQFTVKLSDYQIDVPELMFVKIGEDMELHLNFNMIKTN